MLFSLIDENEKTLECPICYEEKQSFDCLETNCNHKFCNDCMTSMLKTTTNKSPCCPMCRTNIKGLTLKDPEKYTEVLEAYCKPMEHEDDWFF